jgi:hypothetical protein
VTKNTLATPAANGRAVVDYQHAEDPAGDITQIDDALDITC